jgi:hypothetical protein
MSSPRSFARFRAWDEISTELIKSKDKYRGGGEAIDDWDIIIKCQYSLHSVTNRPARILHCNAIHIIFHHYHRPPALALIRREHPYG